MATTTPLSVVNVYVAPFQPSPHISEEIQFKHVTRNVGAAVKKRDIEGGGGGVGLNNAPGGGIRDEG